LDVEKKGRLRYLVEVIRVDETQHGHKFVRTHDLFENITDENEAGEEITIEIKPKDLYEKPTNLIAGFFNWIFTGQVKHYVMVVNQNGKAIKEKAPKVSGKVLKVARDWKGLGKAIKDAFGGGFSLPSSKMILVIIGAIIVLAGLVYSGWIPLPEGVLR
jgi:hypothetical protein